MVLNENSVDSEDSSVNLTAEFVKGFNEGSLRRMRQFYRTFPIRATLWRELSWSHYRWKRRGETKTYAGYVDLKRLSVDVSQNSEQLLTYFRGGSRHVYKVCMACDF